MEALEAQTVQPVTAPSQPEPDAGSGCAQQSPRVEAAFSRWCERKRGLEGGPRRVVVSRRGARGGASGRLFPFRGRSREF